jgi:hypothetical protein
MESPAITLVWLNSYRQLNQSKIGKHTLDSLFQVLFLAFPDKRHRPQGGHVSLAEEAREGGAMGRHQPRSLVVGQLS